MTTSAASTPPTALRARYPLASSMLRDARPGLPTVVLDSRGGRAGGVDAWVARFAALWHAPAGRVDEIMDLLSPDVRLVAPGFRPTTGRAAGQAAFERAFRALPDLRADVWGWAHHDDAVYIDMTCHATAGGRPVAWHDVDRVRFAGGYAVERVAFFDPTRLRRALLRRPVGWRQLWRLRRGV